MIAEERVRELPGGAAEFGTLFPTRRRVRAGTNVLQFIDGGEK
jgi:hypothetical protein